VLRRGAGAVRGAHGCVRSTCTNAYDAPESASGVAELVRLAYYPFLPGVREAVRDHGPGMDGLLTGTLYRDTRRRAVGRVLKVLGDGVLESPTIPDESAAVNELLTQGITRMLVAALGDRIVAQRFAAREAARVRRALRSDSELAVTEALDALGVPVDRSTTPWRIHFSDQLAAAPTRQEWKLVLQTVRDGWVDVPRRAAEAFCEEAWRRRLETELLDEIQRRPADLRVLLRPYLDELGPELVKAKEDWNTGEFGPVKTQAFPPCIVQLFEDMKAGANVPHHGRFAFASFLGTIGMSADQILDFMTQLPNFSREKSEYQIRHIAGELGVEAYTPPSCATMQTNGVCPLEKRDDICFSIRHPLSYYRKALKRVPAAVADGRTTTAEAA
jgi:DNA primase large subunit